MTIFVRFAHEYGHLRPQHTLQMIYLNLEGCLGILKCLQLDLIFFPAWKWNSAFPSAVFLFFTDNTKNNTLPNGTVHMFYLFFTFHGINLLPFIVGRSYYWYMPNYVMRPYICIASPPPPVCIDSWLFSLPLIPNTIFAVNIYYVYCTCKKKTFYKL